MLPIRRWSPSDGVVRFYWIGVWVFLIAITCIAGGMNTLVLLDVDAVAVTERLLNLILPGFVGFVVLGWFHMILRGALKGAMSFRRKGLKSH